jgi:hypothetical protein
LFSGTFRAGDQLGCQWAMVSSAFRRTAASGLRFNDVAADGKLYCIAESGRVYVAALGTAFEVLAKNDLGESCLVTPAISAGTIYIRTQNHLIAIAEQPGTAPSLR